MEPQRKIWRIAMRRMWILIQIGRMVWGDKMKMLKMKVQGRDELQILVRAHHSLLRKLPYWSLNKHQCRIFAWTKHIFTLPYNHSTRTELHVGFFWVGGWVANRYIAKRHKTLTSPNLQDLDYQTDLNHITTIQNSEPRHSCIVITSICTLQLPISCICLVSQRDA